MIRLCWIPYLVILFVWFDILHFVTELLIAFDANSPYFEVFKVSTITVLWATDRA